MHWVQTNTGLPPEKDAPYQVLTIASKKHTKGNYKGQGIKKVTQDWVVRTWPQNFTHWSYIKELNP